MDTAALALRAAGSGTVVPCRDARLCGQAIVQVCTAAVMRIWKQNQARHCRCTFGRRPKNHAPR